MSPKKNKKTTPSGCGEPEPKKKKTTTAITSSSSSSSSSSAQPEIVSIPDDHPVNRHGLPTRCLFGDCTESLLCCACFKCSQTVPKHCKCKTSLDRLQESIPAVVKPLHWLFKMDQTKRDTIVAIMQNFVKYGFMTICFKELKQQIISLTYKDLVMKISIHGSIFHMNTIECGRDREGLECQLPDCDNRDIHQCMVRLGASFVNCSTIADLHVQCQLNYIPMYDSACVFLCACDKECFQITVVNRLNEELGMPLYQPRQAVETSDVLYQVVELPLDLVVEIISWINPTNDQLQKHQLERNRRNEIILDVRKADGASDVESVRKYGYIDYTWPLPEKNFSRWSIDVPPLVAQQWVDMIYEKEKIPRMYLASSSSFSSSSSSSASLFPTALAGYPGQPHPYSSLCDCQHCQVYRDFPPT